jgi:hypothetical protein
LAWSIFFFLQNMCHHPMAGCSVWIGVVGEGPGYRKSCKRSLLRSLVVYITNMDRIPQIQSHRFGFKAKILACIVRSFHGTLVPLAPHVDLHAIRTNATSTWINNGPLPLYSITCSTQYANFPLVLKSSLILIWINVLQ